MVSMKGGMYILITNNYGNSLIFDDISLLLYEMIANNVTYNGK